MKYEEKIINKKEVYRGNFLVMENIDVILPNGNNGNRDIVRHPGAVALVAFTSKDEIVLVEQFRVAINKTILEIPAGKLEKGEDPLEAAKRELEEETGYKAKNIDYLGTIATAPGFTDEQIHIYKATELYEGIKGGDDDEFIDVNSYKISDIKEMIKEGKIIDTKTISSLMYL